MKKVFLFIFLLALSGEVQAHQKQDHAVQPIQPVQPLPPQPLGQSDKSLTDVILWLPPAHPITVHFPVAFLMMAGVIGFISFLKPSSRMTMLFDPLLYVGTVSAILAMATGLYFEEYTPHHHGGLIDPVMETHEILGITVAAMSVVLSLLNLISARKNLPSLKKWIFLGTFILALIISFTSHLGGILVHYFQIAKG